VQLLSEVNLQQQCHQAEFVRAQLLRVHGRCATVTHADLTWLWGSVHIKTSPLAQYLEQQPGLYGAYQHGTEDEVVVMNNK
jgi:hypothetical protein